MRRVRCPHCDGAIFPATADEFTAQDVRRIALRKTRPTTHLLKFLGLMQTVITGLLGLSLRHMASSAQGSELTLAMVFGLTLFVWFVSGTIMLAAGMQGHHGRWRHGVLVGAWMAIFSPLLVGIPIGLQLLRLLRQPDIRATFGFPPSAEDGPHAR